MNATKTNTPANWGKRAVALIIDQLISFPGYFLYIIPGVLIFSFRDSLRGRENSIGRSAVNQMLVNVKTGLPPNTGKRFSRNLIALLFRSWTLGAYTIAEIVVSLSRDDRRCVTDLMFGTIVIEIDENINSAQQIDSAEAATNG